MSLVIKGKIFTAGKVRETGIRIERGTIVAVSENDLGNAERVITLGSHEILAPAGVDALCAMRDWAEAARDTVETVTKGALAAGVTLVCDQANTVPRIDTPELIRKRVAHVAEHSLTDFAVGAHPPKNPAHIDACRDAGVHALQIFPWDLRTWNTPRDADDSREQFARYAKLGLPGVIFPDELALRETSLRDEGETFALKALLRRLDPDFKVRLFITLPDSVERILAVKEKLPNVLIQVAPHSLFVSRDAGFARIGIGATQVPPLRSAEDVARLKQYADEGKIDIVVSHHAPHRMGDKYSSDPIEGEFTPKAGYSAIDFTYPLLVTKLGFEKACRMHAENPARHLGLKKGVIEKGYDADLALFHTDPGTVDKGIHEHGGITAGVWKVDPGDFYSKGRVTPFAGERLKYRVAKTFMRGVEVFDAASATFMRTQVRHVQ